MIPYSCGTYDLCVRDISVISCSSLQKTILDLLELLSIPNMFTQRIEIINLKKISYFVQKKTDMLERKLAQLQSFFYGEGVRRNNPNSNHNSNPNPNTFWKQSPRLTAISDARMTCRGSLAAAHDARALGKLICCLPRHPTKSPNPWLLSAPLNWRSFRVLKEAAEAVSTSISSSDFDFTESTKISNVEIRVQDAIANAGFPPHVREFVSAVLICRGASKGERAKRASLDEDEHASQRASKRSEASSKRSEQVV